MYLDTLSVTMVKESLSKGLYLAAQHRTVPCFDVISLSCPHKTLVVFGFFQL